MKGIAHFSIGVAAASCFPAAVRAGADGNPLYFLLGGIFGLLPDTLDFKFYRFFYPHHAEVTPDPNSPDPQMIADSLAAAMHRARETGEPFNIKLNTIRLGADLWQRYHVRFDVAGREVEVRYGPVVDTGGSPVPGSPSREHRTAAAELAVGIRLDYEAGVTIDAFDGPLFRMCPTDDGRIMPKFIPWHRQWSHSLVVALLAALSVALIWTPLAGFVALAAYALHVLTDQLGFMGSCLLFPFVRRRSPGLGIMHSSLPVWNLFAVWAACALIVWNLYGAAPFRIEHFNILTLCFYALALPAAAFACLRKWADR